MRVDHAAKNMRMCQQRKSAVASSALKNEDPGRRLGANLCTDVIKSYRNSLHVTTYGSGATAKPR
jgi:hypothetical protein